MAAPTRRSAVRRDPDRETEITRHLNALQDIKMGTIATDNVLKEMICHYFVNRDLSDGELSESDTDSNDDKSAAFPPPKRGRGQIRCRGRPKKLQL